MTADEPAPTPRHLPGPRVTSGPAPELHALRVWTIVRRRVSLFTASLGKRATPSGLVAARPGDLRRREAAPQGELQAASGGRSRIHAELRLSRPRIPGVAGDPSPVPCRVCFGGRATVFPAGSPARGRAALPADAGAVPSTPSCAVICCLPRVRAAFHLGRPLSRSDSKPQLKMFLSLSLSLMHPSRFISSLPF